MFCLIPRLSRFAGDGSRGWGLRLCPGGGVGFAIELEGEGEKEVGGKGGEEGRGDWGLVSCMVTEAGEGASHQRGWQVSDGLAPECSREGTETPTQASPQ